MNLFVLQVIYKSGHLTNLLFDDHKSRQFLEGWNQAVVEWLQGADSNGVLYMIKKDEVVALVRVPCPEQQRQEPLQQTISPFGNTIKFPGK